MSKAELSKRFPSSFVWKKEWIRESSYKPPAGGWRPKASQRSGLRFEQNIGKILLHHAKANNFSFFFQKAFDFPQGTKIPDHFWLPAGPEAPPYGFVFETKLTWRAEALTQTETYAGILSSYYELPFVRVIIAKNLSVGVGDRKTNFKKFDPSSLIEFKDLPSLSSEGPWTIHSLWPEHTLRSLSGTDELPSPG